jgi:hypothetical protein
MAQYSATLAASRYQAHLLSPSPNLFCDGNWVTPVKDTDPVYWDGYAYLRCVRLSAHHGPSGYTIPYQHQRQRGDRDPQVWRIETFPGKTIVCVGALRCYNMAWARVPQPDGNGMKTKKLKRADVCWAAAPHRAFMANTADQGGYKSQPCTPSDGGRGRGRDCASAGCGLHIAGQVVQKRMIGRAGQGFSQAPAAGPTATWAAMTLSTSS